MQTQARVREAIASAAESAARKTAEQWQLRLRQELMQAADVVRTVTAERDAAVKQLALKEREAQARFRELEGAVIAAKDQAQREIDRLTTSNQQLLTAVNDAARAGVSRGGSTGGGELDGGSNRSVLDASLMALLLKSITAPAQVTAPQPDVATNAALVEMKTQLRALTSQLASLGAGGGLGGNGAGAGSSFFPGSRAVSRAADVSMESVVDAIAHSIADRNSRLFGPGGVPQRQIRRAGSVDAWEARDPAHNAHPPPSSGAGVDAAEAGAGGDRDLGRDASGLMPVIRQLNLSQSTADLVASLDPAAATSRSTRGPGYPGHPAVEELGRSHLEPPSLAASGADGGDSSRWADARRNSPAGLSFSADADSSLNASRRSGGGNREAPGVAAMRRHVPGSGAQRSSDPSMWFRQDYWSSKYSSQ
jgi:hypothetical protein